MKPEDITRLVAPGDPRLDPTGQKVAFVVSQPDLKHDRYNRVIWLAEEQGTRPFTTGPRDSAPRWSPDGTDLAFLRSPADDKPPQVVVMPVGGGEPKVVTDFKHGVEALEWSPDGTRIAVTAITPTEYWEDADADEAKRRPRRITGLPYRVDTVGWVDDRKRHVWLIDPTGEEEPSCLTPGDFDETLQGWSPDGSRIAIVTDRHPDRALIAGNDIFEVDTVSGEMTRVGGRGLWQVAAYRSDGVLHLLGSASSEYPTIYALHRVEADGSLTGLTGPLDRSLSSVAGGPPFIRWDGPDAVVVFEDSGRAGLIKVGPDGTTTTLVEGDRNVSGADSANGRVVFTASTSTNPGELFSIGPDDESKLTDLNREDLGFVTPDHFRVGPEEIDAWVYLPDGDGKVPLLLNIHGGPASQYGFGFFDEFQVYVSAGYGVVACNPRGSSGRGLDFVRAVTGEGWGTVDLEDIKAVVDEAIARHPRLDPERMGIMGGSYGGFMTAWTIAFEDRWKSAVVERALTNFASFAGTSDIGATFPRMYTGGDYPDGWETWWKKSPLAYAHQVTTPTLVIHSENDFRCPIEQGEQYFTALLRNGTPAEMVRFPGESHELTRSGKPKHRKERFDAILDWHSRYL